MAESASVTLAELTDILSSSAGVMITPDQVAESTTFRELGVDSLALLGAIPILERARRIVLPADAENIETVSEFLNLVNHAGQEAG
jgi:acyl carrier protein